MSAESFADHYSDEDGQSARGGAGEVGDWEYDVESRSLRCCALGWQLLGLEPREAPDPASLFQVVHPEDLVRVRRSIARVLDPVRNEPLHVEFRALHPEGRTVWVELKGEASFAPGPAGPRPVRLRGTLADVTERRREEEHQRFLADASGALGASLEPASALHSLVRLATAQLADYAVVYVCDEDGQIHRSAGGHADPEAMPRLEMLLALDPIPVQSGQIVARVVRSGEPLYFADVTESVLRAAAFDAQHLEVFRALRPRSMVIVPLRARGTVQGALSVVTVDGGKPRIDAQAFGTVQELAIRAALALDNARLYRAEQLARQEAEEANRAKANFLAVMSHELRTPLTAIMAFAELLQMGIPEAIPPAALSHVNRIDHAARHLLRLIEEILTFSRIEAAREEIRLAETELREIAREALEFVQPMAGKKGLSVECLTPDLPVRAYTDGAKVRQVLVNLLFNAVKFTPDGGIRLVVEPREEHVLLHVCDTGIGIAPGMLGKIFEPFWQAQDPATREVGGTGLGLTISQRIARLLSADLSVESTIGEGTTFTLRLPLGGANGSGSAPPASG
jgi:PAS domain S-box-containing protein